MHLSMISVNSKICLKIDSTFYLNQINNKTIINFIYNKTSILKKKYEIITKKLRNYYTFSTPT